MRAFLCAAMSDLRFFSELAEAATEVEVEAITASDVWASLLEEADRLSTLWYLREVKEQFSNTIYFLFLASLLW